MSTFLAILGTIPGFLSVVISYLVYRKMFVLQRSTNTIVEHTNGLMAATNAQSRALGVQEGVLQEKTEQLKGA